MLCSSSHQPIPCTAFSRPGYKRKSLTSVWHILLIHVCIPILVSIYSHLTLFSGTNYITLTIFLPDTIFYWSRMSQTNIFCLILIPFVEPLAKVAFILILDNIRSWKENNNNNSHINQYVYVLCAFYCSHTCSCDLPCSLILRAIRWHCSLVASRFTL